LHSPTTGARNAAFMRDPRLGCFRPKRIVWLRMHAPCALGRRGSSPHKGGIVHHDVKLGNLILREGGCGHAKLYGVRGSLLFVAAVCFSSCLDPTQITVDVRTSYTCGNTDTGIFAGGESALTATDAFTATKSTCDAPDRVGSLVVVPTHTADDVVYLRVVAGVDSTSAAACASAMRPAGASCIEARRILRFVQHQRLILPITLDRSCINLPCPERQTCDKGQCVNAYVDPSCISDPATCPDSGATDAAIGSSSVRMIAAGFDNACAVRESDDAIFCFGSNAVFQLGPNAGNAVVAGVTQIPKPKGITQPIRGIAIGQNHVCVTDGNVVSCWGNNSSSQLGRMSSIMSDPMSDVVALTWTQVASLSAGAEITCAIDVIGGGGNPRTHCWGSLVAGKVLYTVPNNTQLIPDPGFKGIAAGAHHICGFVLKTASCNCSMAADCVPSVCANGATQDRKSTRLNSSHRL